MDINVKIVEKRNYDEFNNSGIEGKPLKIGFFNRLVSVAHK
jgi:hypothetical protein